MSLEKFNFNKSLLGKRYSQKLNKKTNYESEKGLMPIDVNSPDYINNLAESYIKTKNYQEAINILLKEVEGDRNEPFTYFLLVDAYTEIAKYEQAIDIAKKALKKFPDKSTGYNTLSSAYYSKYDFENAIKYQKKAIEHNNEKNELKYNLALYYYSAFEYENAIETLAKILILEYENYRIYSLLGDIYSNLLFDKQDYKKAEEFYKKSILLKSDDSNTYFNLASLYMDLKLTEKAIIELKNSLDCDPLDGRTYYSLGKCFFELKSYENAETYFNFSIEHNFHPNKIYLYLGKISIYLKNHEKAYNYFNTGITEFIDTGIFILPCTDLSTLYFELALLNKDECKYDQSGENLLKAIYYDDDNFEYYYEFGNLMLIIQDYITAESYFEKVIELNHDFKNAIFCMGKAYYYQYEYQKALEQFNLLADYLEEEFYLLKGDCYFYSGNLSTALRVFKKGLKLFPDSNNLKWKITNIVNILKL